jgi:hypothetical protein
MGGKNMSAYTCMTCNGTGIIGYDPDISRLMQEHCPICDGEGVLHHSPNERKSLEEIKEILESAEQERNCMLEPLEKIGLDDRDFFAFINSIEKEVDSKVFTIRILEDEQDPEEENPHLFALLVFENREIMKSKISTFAHEDKIAIRTQGKWL